MASARKKSNGKDISTNRGGAPQAPSRFVVCINNSRYPASLERNKIYRVLRDRHAEKDGDLRVIDESGEDYLYPAEWFVAIKPPSKVKQSVLAGTAG